MLLFIHKIDVCNMMFFRLMDQTPATSSLKLQQLTATSSPFEYVKAGAAVRRDIRDVINFYLLNINHTGS